MQNLNAKLAVVDSKYNPLTSRFLERTLRELRIPPEEIYLTHLGKNIKNNFPTPEELKQDLNQNLSIIQPEIVLTLGKDALYTILFSLLKSNFKLSAYVGKLIESDWKIVPSYDVHYIVGRTKKELDLFKDCFNVIREELFGD